MKIRHQRLLFILLAMAMVAAAALLVLRNLEEYIVYFYSPTDIAVNPPSSDAYIRIGGLVKDNSVELFDDGKVRFIVTDMEYEMVVEYQGILPNLFREGQGVVAEGYYDGNIVTAETILAKHDEYYMPPEVAKSLKKSGRWKPETKPVTQPSEYP